MVRTSDALSVFRAEGLSAQALLVFRRCDLMRVDSVALAGALRYNLSDPFRSRHDRSNSF